MLIKAKLFEFMDFNFYSLKTPYVNFNLILIRLRKTVAEAFRHMEAHGRSFRESANAFKKAGITDLKILNILST